MGDESSNQETACPDGGTMQIAIQGVRRAMLQTTREASLRVFVVYDREGRILWGDVAVEGTTVGEFDMPQEPRGAGDVSGEGRSVEEDLQTLGIPSEAFEQIDIDYVRAEVNRELVGRREAGQLNELRSMRVDIETRSLRPIDEMGAHG